MKTRIEETMATSLKIDIKSNDYSAWATGKDGKIWSGGVRKNENENDYDTYYNPDHSKLYFDNPKQLQETIDILTELQKVLSRYEW